MDLAFRKIAIIGLGYVGLLLAVAFGAIRVVGLDISQSRVDALKRGDKTPGVIYDIKGLFPRHVTDGLF
ncbi:hypothetical protein [Mesorhizobium sp. LjRoot246]|uniref:hypothetical protein n=1 Tax=Mesorhizobium sp. LjRoot246 TaxID=3342294 RepID=UPI003F50C026